MKKAMWLMVAVFLLAVVAVPAIAAAEEGGANAGYSKGFFIKNDEGTFKLKLNGRVQPKFFWDKDPRRVATNPGDKAQYMTFQMRRAQLGVSAQIHDAVTAGFTLRHAMNRAANSTFATVQVAAATVAVEVMPEFTVTVGMVGLPLDMLTETSSAWLLTPELPVTATQDEDFNTGATFVPVRPSFSTPDGLGVNFSGGYWKWFYSFSVVNGEESNYNLNTNRRFSFGFRTGFNILDAVPGSLTDFENSTTPKLTVSLGSMYQGKRFEPNTNAQINYILTSSMGVGVRWVGFSFTGEGYYRMTKMGTAGTIGTLYSRPKLTDIGYYASTGYYVIPKKLELAIQAGQIIRQGPTNDSYQYGGGINYYIFDNNLKLQLAYTLTAAFYGATGAPDPTQLTTRQKEHNIALLASAIF